MGGVYVIDQSMLYCQSFSMCVDRSKYRFPQYQVAHTQCTKLNTDLIFTEPYLVYIWSNQVVQFVEDAVDDFDQQMALLVLQGGRHEERQDLIEQRTSSELTSFICDLTQSGLKTSERRRSLIIQGDGETDRLQSHDGCCLLLPAEWWPTLRPPLRAAAPQRGDALASKYSHCSHGEAERWVWILQ